MLAVVLPAAFTDTPEMFDLAVVAQMHTMQLIHPGANVALGGDIDGPAVVIDNVHLEAWLTYTDNNGRLCLAVTSTLGSTGINTNSDVVDQTMRDAIIAGTATAYRCGESDLILTDE